MPRRIGTSPLLERDQELSQLNELIASAAHGSGGALALVGPAGIGKTRLLAVTREQALRRGLVCAAARGGELERDFAYGVVRQLLERPLAALDEAERRSVLAGAAAPAALALGFAEPTEQRRADETFVVVHGLYWMCMNLAARCPLLMIVDDVHWADAASLRMLAYLARRVEDAPIALLLAARPTSGGENGELLDTLLAADEVSTVRPAPLSRRAVAKLAGLDDGADAAQACWEATGGNPFLCETLLSALEEQVNPPDTAKIAEVAARAVSTVVVTRLGRLPADAVALARAVALLGTDADLRHAAAFTGLSTEAAAAAADALAGQGILAVGRPLEFVHPLVRAAVADRIPPGERLLGHARAARVLDVAGAAPGVVAAHLLAAHPAGDEWALGRLRAAARDAGARGAPEAAVRFLGRALEEAGSGTARAGVLHELGIAAFHAGDAAEAVQRLEEAYELAGDLTDRLPILPDLVTVYATSGQYARAIDVIEPILESGAPDDDLRLQLRAHLVQFATLEPQLHARVERWLGPLEADAARTPAARRGYLAALTAHAALRVDRTAADVRDWARQADEQGIRDDVATGAIAWNNMINPLIFADGYDLAERMIEEAIALARRQSSAIAHLRAYGARSMLELRRGELREAVADARTGIEAGRPGGFYTVMLVLSTLVRALVEHGDLDAAQRELDTAGLADAIPDSFLHNWVLGSRGWLRLAEGDVDAAIADFEQLHRRHLARRLRNPSISGHRSGLALALLRAGEADRALAMVTEELELAERWGADTNIGISRRTLGLVTGGKAGLAHVHASVDILGGSPARLEHARSLIELGAALRRGGARAEAREPLRAGMELAFACAAEPLVEQAHQELLACGARPRRIMRTGVDALTPSELRVARMAAEGMTTREIAQALFVTLRTVQVHLTHCYQKLDISSRAELPAVLQRSA